MDRKAIDNYITRKYQHLFKCALVKSKNKEKSIDLISELYVYLTNPKNENLLLKYMDNEVDFEKFCVRWIQNQIKWNNSPFNNKFRITATDLVLDDNKFIVEPEFFDVSEFEQDLATIYSEEQIEKILFTYKIYNSILNDSEKVLFELYFIQRMSLQKIKDSIKIKNNKKFYNNRTIIYYKIKEIKEKILNEYNRTSLLDIPNGK